MPDPCSFSVNNAASQPPANPRFRVLKYLNCGAFVVTQAVNALPVAKVISPYTIADVSHMFPTGFTPAGPAFSIWGAIYALQAGFVVLPFVAGDQPEVEATISRIGLTFAAACAANCLWIATFVQGTLPAVCVSVGFIFGLLASLVRIYRECGFWRSGDTARPSPCGWKGAMAFLCLDVHFTSYASWVAVASLLNATAALAGGGWLPLAPRCWSALMLFTALTVSARVAVRNLDPVWPSLLCWATGWIAVAPQNDDRTRVLSGAVCVAAALLSALAATLRVFRSRADGARQDDSSMATALRP